MAAAKTSTLEISKARTNPKKNPNVRMVRHTEPYVIDSIIALVKADQGVDIKPGQVVTAATRFYLRELQEQRGIK